MKIFRRILGIFVMIAGILGLLLSVAGLVMVWRIKPTVAVYVNTTIDTLNSSVTTSQDVMAITGQALGATIDSVDALSVMLGTTAATVEDTQPVLDQIDAIMRDTLPTTLQATSDSLYTAQQAAQVLESTIQSLEAFRFLLGSAPLVGDLVGTTEASYNPEKPLADSLGELAENLESLPDTFIEMSASLSTTDEKLVTIQSNLITMSTSIELISASLGEYQTMILQSQSSVGNLTSILNNIENNLPAILNTVTIILSLLFFWLLATQVVILSQGWELYQGTADRLEGEGE